MTRPAHEHQWEKPKNTAPGDSATVRVTGAETEDGGHHGSEGQRVDGRGPVLECGTPPHSLPVGRV